MNPARNPKPGFFLTLLGVLLLAGCTNSDVKDREIADAHLKELYLSYTILAEEGSDWVTCFVQFKTSRTGRVEALPRGARILLDGEPLPADTAGVSGVYYELQKPLEEFLGEHTLVLKASGGATYETPFAFPAITLLTDLNGRVHRQDLQVQFQGIQQDDLVQISAIDTSFASNDIIKESFAQENSVSILETDWQNLENGPITMDITIESATPLRHTTKGGRLLISYTLKRDFVLTN